MDNRNPERLHRVDGAAIGLLAGVHHDFRDLITAAVDGRLDWLNLWHYPNGERSEGVHDGIRAGPEVSVAWWFGRAWGHHLSFELRAAYLFSNVPVEGESSWHGWQLGGALGGALLPEPNSAK